MEVWTTADALKGLCEMEDVGDVRETPRPPDATPEATDAEATDATTTVEPDAPLVVTAAAVALAKERGIDPTDAEAMALIMLEVDPEGFARKNPTIFLHILKSQQAERASKQSEMLTLATATAGQIKAMSTQTVYTHLAMAIFAEADEVRDRMLARLGVTVADLKEILAHGSDSD